MGLSMLLVCPRFSALLKNRNSNGNTDFCAIMAGLEIENDRLRHIRLHERVNDLPDPNYATLKYFLGHLYKYVSRVSHSMTPKYTDTHALE